MQFIHFESRLNILLCGDINVNNFSLVVERAYFVFASHFYLVGYLCVDHLRSTVVVLIACHSHMGATSTRLIVGSEIREYDSPKLIVGSEVRVPTPQS